MQPAPSISNVPIAFIKRCLEKDIIRVRQRWAVMVFNLWIKQGWARPLGDGCFELSASGKSILNSYLHSYHHTNFELLLSELNIILPQECDRKIFSELQQYDPAFSSQSLSEHNIQLSDHRYLSFRTSLPCSLFLDSGELIDIAAQICSWQQFVLPEKAGLQISKWLWQQYAPSTVITVDDFHAFSSIPLLEHQLIIHAPNHRTDLAEKVFHTLNHEMKWAHVCDLTPQGLSSACRFALNIQRPLKLYLPENWKDFLRKLGKPTPEKCTWPFSELSRDLQIKLDFLLCNNHVLSQRMFTYAKNWTDEL